MDFHQAAGGRVHGSCPAPGRSAVASRRLRDWRGCAQRGVLCLARFNQRQAHLLRDLEQRRRRREVDDLARAR